MKTPYGSKFHCKLEGPSLEHLQEIHNYYQGARTLDPDLMWIGNLGPKHSGPKTTLPSHGLDPDTIVELTDP